MTYDLFVWWRCLVSISSHLCLEVAAYVSESNLAIFLFEQCKVSCSGSAKLWVEKRFCHVACLKWQLFKLFINLEACYLSPWRWLSGHKIGKTAAKLSNDFVQDCRWQLCSNLCVPHSMPTNISKEYIFSFILGDGKKGSTLSNSGHTRF